MGSGINDILALQRVCELAYDNGRCVAQQRTRGVTYDVL